MEKKAILEQNTISDLFIKYLRLKNIVIFEQRYCPALLPGFSFSGSLSIRQCTYGATKKLCGPPSQLHKNPLTKKEKRKSERVNRAGTPSRITLLAT